MRTCTVLAVVISIAALCLAGCGGGSGVTTPPPPQNTSAIEGEVTIQGAAADYELLLDGQPVPGVLRDDGSYEIESVPPGRHRVAVVERGGMEGGYATVEVPDGRRVRAPRIVTEAGGQIVGMVMVVEDGVLRPLEGVEVTAQPMRLILPDDGEPGQATPGDAPVSDVLRPDIYPPPDDVPTFETFTDADGSFIIRAVPEGEYIVNVAQPGMEQTWQCAGVEAGRTSVADFRLRLAIEPGVGTVRGVVMGTQGRLTAPVMGARVTVVSDHGWGPIGPPVPMEPADDEGEGRGDAEPGGPARPDPDMIAPPWFEGVSTVTNERGEFSLNAPAGYASIEVYMPGWAPVWREITIEPEQTLTLRFRLEDIEDWPPPPPPGEGEVPSPMPELGGETPPAPPVTNTR